VAIPRVLPRQGSHVFVSSRRLVGWQAVADPIVNEVGKATAFGCHFGEMEQIPAVVGQISQQFGRLDVLVNHAGSTPQFCNVL
ncbi:SDR family NAD(P)-dependent oxidoreductase, partial [Pseudomonas syringae group genomosp. 7]|uniref:SDR family NAD(P)-dependent oxidoreductase n=1 Tax=Pseudomonas syringae group genomosp. 7 TaxID=251699 RepID=UPI00376F9173